MLETAQLPKGGWGERGILALRQPQWSPDRHWEKGQGRHSCGEGVLARLFPRRAGREAPPGGWGRGERWWYPAVGCLSGAGFAPAFPHLCR